MSSPNLYAVAAAARTKRIRLGAMGHVVPLHHPVRLLEEIALTDQITGGRVEIGLVPGILASYFGPFGVDFATRREITLEFARFLKAGFKQDGAFDFEGKLIKQKGLNLSVPPVQRPHPPMWMETRDKPTLEFCAREGLHTGYFLLFPRSEARTRYEPYRRGWKEHGWPGIPNIAYSTVVYVDETDQKALDVAIEDAGRAYKGFFTYSDDPEIIRAKQKEAAEYFLTRGEPGAAEILMNLLDPDYLLEHDLVLIGSPDTVARHIQTMRDMGVGHVLCWMNFGGLPQDKIRRSMELFAREVMPHFRD
jgi:alkanesulfonate monooxygenase SsuD/methylene tetrahydromethanopterin reductase-like flavin-dependent oxidoreductase (luciferase family)